MAEGPEPLAESRRLDSVTKVARVRAAIDAMAVSGNALTVAALARHARVSRRFIYDHPELRAEAEAQVARLAQRDSATLAATARVTAASLRTDLANARAANQRLHGELAALRRRLGCLLGKDVLAEVAGTETGEISGRLWPEPLPSRPLPAAIDPPMTSSPSSTASDYAESINTPDPSHPSHQGASPTVGGDSA